MRPGAWLAAPVAPVPRRTQGTAWQATRPVRNGNICTRQSPVWDGLFSRTTSVYFACIPCPLGVPPFVAWSVRAGALNTPAAWGATWRGWTVARCANGNQYACVSATTITAFTWHSARCWAMCPAITGAGEQYREAGLPIPDTRATFVPTRLLQRSLLYRTVRKTAMHGDSEGRTARTLRMP